jgi:hypothetical protein
MSRLPILVLLCTSHLAIAQQQPRVNIGIDWLEFHRGPKHDGNNPKDTAISIDNVATLQLRWKAATGGAIFGSSHR